MKKKGLVTIGVVVVVVFLFAPVMFMMGFVFLLSPSASTACLPRQSSSAIADAPVNLALLDAIKYVAKGDVQVAASMTIGTHLESRAQSVASKDGAFGPYQIQNPGAYPNPTISVADAMNPATATNYMYPRYLAGLRTIPGDLWVSDPMFAAMSVAYAAERPKYRYDDSRSQGADQVRASWQFTVTALTQMGFDTNFATASAQSASSSAIVDSPTASSQTLNCEPYAAVQFTSSEPLVEKVISMAQSQLGVPYVYGGGNRNGPTTSSLAHGNFGVSGFDCSSFTQYSFYQGAGIEIPRTAKSQWLATQQYRVEPGSEQPGDLVFFGGYLGSSGPGHVGIVIDPAKKIMINEPKTGDVVSYDSYDWGSDIVGFTRPYPVETIHPTATS